MKSFNLLDLEPTYPRIIRKQRGIVGWYRMWIARGKSPIGREIVYPLSLEPIEGRWMGQALSYGDSK